MHLGASIFDVKGVQPRLDGLMHRSLIVQEQEVVVRRNRGHPAFPFDHCESLAHTEHDISRMVRGGNGAEQGVRACPQTDRRLGTPSRADALGTAHVPRPVRQTSFLGLPRRNEVIHVHPVGQFDKLDVMRLLSVIGITADQLIGSGRRLSGNG